MSIWAGFGAELPKAYENNRRRRLDTLNAFNEFKKNNPYATGTEFQQFIDTAAGNSNYLRGGLPGQEILDAIEKENAKNREIRDMTRATNTIEQLGKIEGVYGSQLDQAVLGMKPDASEDDYNAAYTAFINTLPEGPAREAYGNKAQPRFNQGYRSNLVTGQIRDNLPDALTFMKSSAGSDVTAADLGQYFGLPSDVAEGLFTRTNELYSQEQQQLQQQNYDAAVSSGLRLIKETPDIDTAKLTADIKAIYPNIADQFQGDFFEKVAADALERERITEEERLREIQRAAGVVGRSITSAAENSSLTQQAILQGDQAGWTQNLLDQFKEEFSDEEFELYFGKKKAEQDSSYFDSNWNDLVGIARENQRREQQNKRVEGASAAVLQAQKYMETNAQRGDELFKFAGAEGQAVEELLSMQYDMNPSFMRAAADLTNRIVQGAGEDTTVLPEDIVSQIKSNADVMALTGPIADAAAASGNKMLQINGAFDVETADSYLTNFQTEYTEKFGQLEDYVEQVMSSQLPLEQKQTLLAQVQMEANSFHSSSLSNHLQRERRQDNWVTRGTGGYDAERANVLAQEVEQFNIGLGSRISQAQEDVIRQIEEQAESPDVNTETSQIATPLFNTTLESVLSDAGDFDGENGPMNAMDAMTNLKRKLRERTVHPRNSQTLSGHEDTRDQLRMIEKYLDDVVMGGGLFDGPKITVQSRIAASREKFQEFIRDPLGYMLSDEDFLNKYPQFRQSVDE